MVCRKTSVFNCGGDHDPEFLECPVRVKEIEVAKVRVVNQIAYAEESKRFEKTSDASEEKVVDRPQPVINVCCQSKDTLCVKKCGFYGVHCHSYKL
jgi:hypothetical protein